MPLFFTKSDDLRTTGPLIPVGIGVPEVHSSIEPIATVAMLDTASDWTVIREGIATSLGLQPNGIVVLPSRYKAYQECPTYSVFLHFPEAKPCKVSVIEALLLSVACLIGRDILSNVTMTYDGVHNMFSLVLWD